MLVNKLVSLVCFVCTYLLSVVEDILISEDCILVFKTFCFEQRLKGILEEFDVAVVVWLMQVNQKTCHWNLIDSQTGVFGKHGQ